MTPNETVLWSAELGSLGVIVLLALADLVYTRSRAAAQSLGFLGIAWLFVLLLSGLLPELLPTYDTAWLLSVQVLVGPLSASISSYWAGLWLSARKRDRLMETSLRAVSALCLAGAPLCLLLPANWQLPCSAALTLLNTALLMWLSVRAAQLGDRMAWGLALGCLLSLPFQLGLYALALGNRPPLGVQFAVALFGLVAFSVVGVMLWLRNRRHLRTQRDVPSEIDPITQLWGSMAIVQKIIAAQRRQANTDSDGLVLAVLVFEPEKLAAQVGQYGLNEIYAELARRLRRQVGVLNPVGRYYDRCFVGLIETLHSPKLMRTTGLRVATGLRRPLEIASPTGYRVTLTLDIGVGLVHFSRATKDVDQLLHDAQHLAELAREMRSRTAVLDPATRAPVPVEKAALDGSWASLRLQVIQDPQDSVLLR